SLSSTEHPHLPSDVCNYEHQITGYGNLLPHKIGDDPLGQFLYSPSERCVYKPVQEAPKGPREVNFYEAVFGSRKDEPPFDPQQRHQVQQLSALRCFLSSFLGVHQHPVTGKLYIRLSDLLDGFARPSIIDIKMGARRHEPDCSGETKERPDRYAYRQQTGFFVTGMRLWRQECHGYELHGKRYGREVTPSNMQTAVLQPLLSTAPAQHRVFLVKQLLAGLESLQRWFETQRMYHFYASSILLGVESCPQRDPDVLVCMVDFTHVVPVPDNQPDTGYLLGLGNLIGICCECERELLPAQRDSSQVVDVFHPLNN
ncbi:hypothetical protein BOX15_Mlig022499g2, partial [Macrostomum lignano]